MDDTFRFVWGEYRAWAVTSRVLKVRITRISLVVLCLTIVGTAIGTLSPLFAVPNASAKLQAAAGVLKFLPWAAAVALGIAAYLTNQLITDSQSQAWAKARALAEGLKSESYKYVTAAPPYDVPNAAPLLGEKFAEFQRVLPSVLPEQISPEERARNLPEGPMTLADYVQKRVREQIDQFYRPAILRHRAALTRARALALGAGIAAVILSAGTSTMGTWAPAALGIVTTVAAATAAWFQSGSHQQIALNYQDAINKLELLVARHRAAGLADKQLVVDAESVFQAEHGAWLAEWQSAPSPTPARNIAVVVPVEPLAAAAENP